MEEKNDHRATVEKLYITTGSARAWNQCFSPGGSVTWSPGRNTTSRRQV